jgi:hypothetical protein
MGEAMRFEMRRSLLLSLLGSTLLAAGCAVDLNGEGGASGSTGSSLVQPKPGTGGSCQPQSVFQNAVCLCGDFAHAGSLVTEAPKGGLASVGVNGTFSAATGSRIAGALGAYGDVSMAGDLEIAQDLLTAGDVSGAGRLHVGRDATIQRSLSLAGELSIARTLKIGGEYVVVGSQHVGAHETFSGTVDSPCECDPSKRLDVAARVAAQGEGIDVSGDLDVGPGAHVYRSLRLSKMRVTGAAQVYVSGDITSIGHGQIELAPGATLELFVAGNVTTVGSVTFGDPSRPEAFRLYVGGKDTVTIASAGSVAWNGLVYAPDAEIAFAGSSEVSGALFARDLSYAGTLRVRFAGAPPIDDCKGGGFKDGGVTVNEGGSNADGGANSDGGVTVNEGGANADGGASSDAGGGCK